MPYGIGPRVRAPSQRALVWGVSEPRRKYNDVWGKTMVVLTLGFLHWHWPTSPLYFQVKKPDQQRRGRTFWGSSEQQNINRNYSKWFNAFLLLLLIPGQQAFTRPSEDSFLWRMQTKHWSLSSFHFVPWTATFCLLSPYRHKWITNLQNGYEKCQVAINNFIKVEQKDLKCHLQKIHQLGKIFNEDS